MAPRNTLRRHKRKKGKSKVTSPEWRSSKFRLQPWHPFQDAAAFLSWWSGSYDFVTLRKARNQVVHKCYTFAAGRLTVADDGGTQLLSWTEAEILAFTKAILERAKRV